MDEPHYGYVGVATVRTPIRKHVVLPKRGLPHSPRLADFVDSSAYTLHSDEFD